MEDESIEATDCICVHVMVPDVSFGKLAVGSFMYNQNFLSVLSYRTRIQSSFIGFECNEFIPLIDRVRGPYCNRRAEVFSCRFILLGLERRYGVRLIVFSPKTHLKGNARAGIPDLITGHQTLAQQVFPNSMTFTHPALDFEFSFWCIVLLPEIVPSIASWSSTAQ